MPLGLGNYPDPRYLGPLIGASRLDLSPVPANIPDVFRNAIALRAGGTGSTLADALNAGTNLALNVGQSVQDTQNQQAAQNLAQSQSAGYNQALRTGTVPTGLQINSPDDALKLQQLFNLRSQTNLREQPLPNDTIDSINAATGLKLAYGTNLSAVAPAIAAAKIGTMQDALGNKQDSAQTNADNKEWQQIQKENPMTLGPRNNTGIAWNLMQKARRAMAVLSQPGVTNEQINASNADLGSIYTGGNTVEKNIFDQLQYNTLQDRYKKFMTFLTSTPQAAANPDVVNSLRQNLSDVASVSQDLVNRAINSTAIGHGDYISRHPQQWEAYKQNILGGASFNVPSWPQAGGAGMPTTPQQGGAWRTNPMALTIRNQLKSGAISPDAAYAAIANLKRSVTNGQ